MTVGDVRRAIMQAVLDFERVKMDLEDFKFKDAREHARVGARMMQALLNQMDAS